MMLRVRLMVAILVGLLGLVGCTASKPPAAPAPTESGSEEYRLGVGDVISIRIFGGEEDLRFERIRLNHPGTITLHFGEITAIGRTARELESAMTQAMRGGFLLNPKVWVNIEEYRRFFVEGQVTRPGAFPYQPGLNVSKAVTIAGGFRERASKEKIFVVREQDKSQTPVRAGLNTPVGPGDTITVEESFF